MNQKEDVLGIFLSLYKFDNGQNVYYQMHKG
jgi:hypothetical protein